MTQQLHCRPAFQCLLQVIIAKNHWSVFCSINAGPSLGLFLSILILPYIIKILSLWSGVRFGVKFLLVLQKVVIDGWMLGQPKSQIWFWAWAATWMVCQMSNGRNSPMLTTSGLTYPNLPDAVGFPSLLTTRSTPPPSAGIDGQKGGGQLCCAHDIRRQTGNGDSSTMTINSGLPHPQLF